MEELEISRVIHEYVMIFTFLTGIVVSVLKGREHNLPSYLTLLLFLSATIFFIGFGVLGQLYILPSIQSMYRVFPHITNTFGLAGLLIGIIMGSLILKIPRSFLYELSLVILFLYILIHFGCIAGYCREIEPSGMLGRNWVFKYSPADIYQATIASVFQLMSHKAILIKIITGLLLFSLAWIISLRIRNRKNVMLLSLFMLFLLNFIHQFNLGQNEDILISEKLMGLNIFQWGFLTVNILIVLRILSNEFSTRCRQPRLKLTSPSDYRIVIFFLLLSLASLKFSTWFSLIDPYLLIMAHLFATIFLIIYLYRKIRISYIRYATIILILLAGVIVLLGQFKSHDEYTYGSKPQYSIVKEFNTPSGTINIESNTDFPQVYIDTEITQEDSLQYNRDITSTFPDIQVSRYPYLYDLIYPHLETDNPNGRKTRHGRFR